MSDQATRIETALGGAYEMPDGRKFWIDAPVAREMTRRVLRALEWKPKRADELGRPLTEKERQENLLHAIFEEPSP